MKTTLTWSEYLKENPIDETLPAPERRKKLSEMYQEWSLNYQPGSPAIWLHSMESSTHAQAPIKEILVSIGIMFIIFLICWLMGEMGLLVFSSSGEI